VKKHKDRTSEDNVEVYPYKRLEKAKLQR